MHSQASLLMPLKKLQIAANPRARHFRTTTCAPIYRSISSYTCLQQNNLPPRPQSPPESEIEEAYLKGSGPGGQKINKTSSAVQLKHIPTGIVVKSQATRSRDQNRKHARELLAQKVDDLRNGSQSRSAIVGVVKKKRADSAAKKSRRKYRKLEDNTSSAPTDARNAVEIVETSTRPHSDLQKGSDEGSKS